MTGRRSRPRPLPEMRPYVLTGGRVQDREHGIQFDTLVEAQRGSAPAGLSPEQRDILVRLTGTHLTVAEIAAHLQLPLGVAQVLVSDLAAAGALRVRDAGLPDLGGTTSDEQRFLVLDVLESVFDGISAL